MQAGDLTHPHQPDQTTSCAEQVCILRWADLPLGCPLHGTTLWNGHPRVYLAIHHTGREACPYCGTVYILQPPVPGEPTPTFANLEIERCYWRAMEKATRDAKPKAEDAPA